MHTSSDADALLKQATGAFENARNAEAEALQRKAVDLIRGHDSEDDRIPRALETLAAIHFIQGKFEAAANGYQEVLDFLEARPPADARVIWRVLYWLGSSHFKHQSYEKAEASLRRALSIAEKLADNTNDLATSLYQLGFLLYFVGKYQEGEPYLLRALPLYEETRGAGNIYTVEVLTRIALTYEHCPEIGKDPEPYLRKAVDSAKPEGDTYEAHIENLCRLGELIAARGRFEEADELFSRLLNLLNTGRSDKSASHWVISECVKYFQSRNKSEAVKKLAASEKDYNAFGEITQDRLSHAEQMLSEDDPEFAEALFASANHLIFTGKYEEAEGQLRRALDSYQKIHGDKSLQVVLVLNRLCVAARLLKKFDEAELAIDRALAIARESFADQSIYPRALENLALLRSAEEKTGEATEIYVQAIVEMERICGFPSYETSEALYRQSGHLFRAKEFGLAEAAIQRAISVMNEIVELSDFEKSDYFGTLAAILDAQGRTAEAKEMDERGKDLYKQAELASENEY